MNTLTKYTTERKQQLRNRVHWIETPRGASRFIAGLIIFTGLVTVLPGMLS